MLGDASTRSLLGDPRICRSRCGRNTSVAKQRIVNTKFWDDSYIASLKPMEKLVFLYLLTNPLTNISGVYELPLKRVAFDTGIAVEKVEGTIKKLVEDRKVVASGGWIGIANFIKHQTLNPKVKQGIVSELTRAPKELTDRLSIDYQALCGGLDSLSHLNSNFNLNNTPNPNSNVLPLGQLSTGIPQDIRERRNVLVEKWRV